MDTATPQTTTEKINPECKENLNEEPKKNFLNKLQLAWKEREHIGDSKQKEHLTAFLPAILEVQETPPNPLTKWVGRTLILLFILTVIWACVGKVNVVASAEGKIIPSSRIKTIQPMEKSIVKNILVKEGDNVVKGQALIELDATRTNADEKQLQQELTNNHFQLAINIAFTHILKKVNLNNTQFTTKEIIENLNIKNILLGSSKANNIHQSDIQLHQQILLQQWQEYASQKNGLLSNLNQIKAEYASTKNQIDKLTQTLPIITKRTSTTKKAFKDGIVKEADYLLLEQERIQQKQDLASQKNQLKSLSAQIAEVKERLTTYTAQTYSQKLQTISELNNKQARLKEELKKAYNTTARKILYAPVNGQVQQLSTNTIGGVVTDAQQIMIIVPSAEQLEVEVFLPNKDIGFVQIGMPAEIKIHTFPFTKYGVIDGEITSISNDAIADEKQGLIYSMRVRMHTNIISTNGREIKLKPGMAVTAEVQTDKRHIIEFFTAPLMRYSQEGLKER